MELTKCKLGELITQRREKNDGSDLPICGVSKDGLIPPKQKDADTSIYNVFYRDDFIFNPARMELNSIAINDMYDRAICSSLYEVFYVHRTDLLLPHYLKLIIRQKWFTRYCEFLGQGSAREYCRFSNISEIEIEFPPVEEQQKIVDYNTVIENRIALKQKINDNLEEAASAIFKSYFVTFEHYGGNMPPNWKQATIGDVVSVSRGASPRPIQDYISQSGMPWVKISDASSSVSKYLFKTAEYIIPEGIQNSRTVTKGMMIVSNSASPGLPMIMEITACVHDGWLIIDDYDCVTQEFMYYHFLNERQSLISSSNGSVFNNLKIDIVKSHPIIIPDEETMTKVTQQFRRLNKAIKQNAKEINSLVELQYNLLSKLSNY